MFDAHHVVNINISAQCSCAYRDPTLKELTRHDRWRRLFLKWFAVFSIRHTSTVLEVSQHLSGQAGTVYLKLTAIFSRLTIDSGKTVWILQVVLRYFGCCERSQNRVCVNQFFIRFNASYTVWNVMSRGCISNNFCCVTFPAAALSNLCCKPWGCDCGHPKDASF